MTNQERAAEVMETHDLFHFTSGDGWMEPHEDVIRCACGEEFFSYIQTGDGSGDDDRDPNLLYRQHLAQALADAGLLMPDSPEPKWPGFWEVGGLEINLADKDGEVLIEWEDESDYAYYGTQTRTLCLNRDQVLAIIAASKLAGEQK